MTSHSSVPPISAIASPDAPIIAVLRASTSQYFPAASKALHDGGIRSIEVTMTTPGALRSLGDVRSELGPEVLLGVGSISTFDDAEEAIEAGAQYLVTAGFHPELVRSVTSLGIPIVPGALTPTEISAAWAIGATAVKVFPVGSLGGPSYISALRGPLPSIPLVPSGGVRIEEIAAYLAAGVCAVGLGGTLLGDALDTDGDLKGLYERAARATYAAQRASVEVDAK